MARASRDIAFCARRGALFALERFFGALGDMVFSFPRRSIAARASWPLFL
jgi:hypothetical protein